MQRWLVGQVVTAEKIRQAKDFYQLHFGYNLFNEEGKSCHPTCLSNHCFLLQHSQRHHTNSA